MIPTDDKMLKLAGKIQEAFKQFYLAGGTAIMFKHRHRQSFDLDFFSEKSFSYQRLAAKVRKLYVVENEFRLEDNIDLYLCSINILKKNTMPGVFSFDLSGCLFFGGIFV